MNNNHRTLGFAKWLFCGPALIHIWWAKCIWSAKIELVTTALRDIYAIVGHNHFWAGVLTFTAGVLALASIVVHRRSRVLSLVLLIPQQMAMLISAFTAFQCIQAGTFADGAKYDPYFISADQCYIFVIGAAHTALIIDVYVWEGAVKWMRASFRSLLPP